MLLVSGYPSMTSRPATRYETVNVKLQVKQGQTEGRAEAGGWLSYRGTSLTRNRNPLGPYSRTVPRALWW